MTKRKPLKMDDSDEDAVIEVGSDSDSDDNDFEVDVSEEAPSPAKPKSKPSVSAVKRHALPFSVLAKCGTAFPMFTSLLTEVPASFSEPTNNLKPACSTDSCTENLDAWSRANGRLYGVCRDAAAKATSVPPAAAKAARALPKSFAATSSIKESPAAITPKAASQPQAASVVKSPSAPASKVHFGTSQIGSTS